MVWLSEFVSPSVVFPSTPSRWKAHTNELYQTRQTKTRVGSPSRR